MTAISEYKIKTLLDREDIENLLALGAPGDEYQSEAQMIHRAVTKLHNDRPQNFTTERVTDVIEAVWQEMFGPIEAEQLAAREPVFRKIAAEICAAVKA
jgi:hypothetical protein